MSSDTPKATHTGVLKIGTAEIPCYVLENGVRILSTRGIMKSLGRVWRGRKYAGTKYPVFLEANNLKPFISEELEAVLTPQIFVTNTGKTSEGFNADILPLICETYLTANDQGKLIASQVSVAKQCDILVRGLSRVGIVALVDEATGYQDVRARQALEKILDKFISQELSKWAKQFPDEFYKEMFRLKEWKYEPWSVKRPGVVGKYTNNLVYDRLAPGVLEELRVLNPKDHKGRRKNRHHQWLTEDIGHPRLREHLAAVIALMKASTSWKTFHILLDRAFPSLNSTLPLPFPDEE